MRNFQKLLWVFFTVVLLCFQMARADEASVKILFHLNDPKKFTLLVNSVENARKIYGEKASIVVVVNGPAVSRLARFSNTGGQIKSMLNNGAKLGVCSRALLNLKVDPTNIDPHVSILNKGGLATIIKLQGLGYHYIKI